MSRSRRGTGLAAALLALAVVGGCSGGSDGGASSSSDSAPSEGGVATAGGNQAGGNQAGRNQAGGDQAGGDQAALLERKEIRSAQMSVRAKDITAAGAQVRRIVTVAKGFVSDEQTTNADGHSQSELTLRVPTSSLDRVMQQVADVGSVLERSQSTQDVTSTYLDTASRMRSQTASVDRVRALLAKATSIGQVIEIEGELAKRQADLESLQAQLKRLDDETALSTLVVSLTPYPVVEKPRPDHEDKGFLVGMSSGWTALTASLADALTVVGAVLPFVVVAALVGLPVLAWTRRRRRPRLPAGETAPPAPS